MPMLASVISPGECVLAFCGQSSRGSDPATPTREGASVLSAGHYTVCMSCHHDALVGAGRSVVTIVFVLSW